MASFHPISCQKNMSYEEMSFENLVFFYKDELSKVRKGVNASVVLSKYDVKKLKKRVLRLASRQEGGRRIALTKEVEEIFEEP